ncbi:MAG TPA: hypothetical protein PKD31_28655, partial [Blastocatellia bacterium]|nr:hypothetical protein [Blastocatellia bacterium]
QRNGLSDATWDIYLHQREEQKDLKGLQAPVDTKRSAHLILETSGTLGTTARVATDWLRKQEQSA